MQRRAGGGESRQSQSPRHRREDRRAAESRSAVRQGGDRRARLSQSGSHRCGAERARRTAGGDGACAAPNGKTVVIDFGGPNIAKPMHVRSSALLHHRRLPAAAVPRQWLEGGQRRASGRLGPADGPADLRDRDRGHRAGLFRCRLHRSVSGAIAGDDGRSGRDLSGAPPPPAKPIRRGWKRRAAPRWICRPAAPAIARCGGISSRSRKSGLDARIRQPGRQVRSVERRIQRRCADRAHAGGSESARPGRNQRRRAGGAGGARTTTRSRCRR